MRVAVCWKWFSLDADVVADSRWAGVSRADEAALEVGLSLAGDGPVTVVSLGPEAADDTLRSAIAAGADDAIRIDAATDLDSRAVATALATEVSSADLVVCGDYSMDRGTGSVPAFIAAELEAAQALGLVAVDLTATTAPLRVVRRLDGGRREILEVPTPAVISVEGSAARLRRAPLTASLATRAMRISTVPGPYAQPSEAEVHPYRPRTRQVSAPAGNTMTRIRELLAIGQVERHVERLAVEPAEAADKIIEQLHEWGYLDAENAQRVR